jgi:2-methylcitrate dehydratase PrpD
MDTRAAAHNEAIGRWVSELVLTAVPDSVLERHRLVLADLLTVTSAGINLPEYQKLLQSWLTPVGLVPVPGSQVMTHTEPASFLFGTASVALELDEGSKYAKGHPASHVIPAALSLAAELSATG